MFDRVSALLLLLVCILGAGLVWEWRWLDSSLSVASPIGEATVGVTRESSAPAFELSALETLATTRSRPLF